MPPLLRPFVSEAARLASNKTKYPRQDSNLQPSAPEAERVFAQSETSTRSRLAGSEYQPITSDHWFLYGNYR